jgi:hypothetical protein
MHDLKNSAHFTMLFFLGVSMQGCGSSPAEQRGNPTVIGGAMFGTGGRSSSGTTSGNATGGIVTAAGGQAPTGGSHSSGGASTTTSGGNPATGGTGSVILRTGGTSSTGGVTATGGTTVAMSATGGISSLPTGGTTAILPITGGVTSIGGSGTLGGGTAGGASGTCVPKPRPEPAPVSSAWNCSAPVADNLFSVSWLNSADKAVAYSQTGIWVLAKNTEHSYLLNWDGNAWSTPRQLVIEGHSEFTALTYDASALHPIIWVGGHGECAGCPSVPRIIRFTVGSLNAIMSQEISDGLPSTGEVVSLWTGEQRTFALLNDENASSVYELVDNGSSKTWTRSALFEGIVGKELWGTSTEDLYVIGRKSEGLDASSSSAFATHLDDCGWSSISLPNDIERLDGIHGVAGTVILIGNTATGPARLISSDLVNWTRSNGDGSTSQEGPVWMASSNAVLVGASGNDSEHVGDGMLLMGTNPWKSVAVEIDVSKGVPSIARIPQTDTYVLTSAAKTVDGTAAKVYRVSCQAQ